MSIPPFLTGLIGQWTGSNRFWMMPEAPSLDSDTSAVITTVAEGKFLLFHFTWTIEGGHQSGLLLLGVDPASGDVHASWVDSWHNGDRIMQCRGAVHGEQNTWVQGSYPALEGPDWGWRIVVEPPGEQGFRMLMYNIPPGGSEMLAVESVYTRKPQG